MVMVKIKVKNKSLKEAPYAFDLNDQLKDKFNKTYSIPDKYAKDEKSKEIKNDLEQNMDFGIEKSPVKDKISKKFQAPFTDSSGKTFYVLFNIDFGQAEPIEVNDQKFEDVVSLPEDWLKTALERYGVEEAKAGVDDFLEPRETIRVNEKKDRCYHQAKRKYKVFPSAYASGYIVRCRKGKVGRKRKKKNEDIQLDENIILDLIEQNLLEEGTFDKEKSKGLHGWFQRQGGKGKSKGWVDCNTCRTNPKTGRKTCKSCGRQDGEKRGKYPACRPTPSACNKTGTRKKKSSKRVSWKRKEK